MSGLLSTWFPGTSRTAQDQQMWFLQVVMFVFSPSNFFFFAACLCLECFVISHAVNLEKKCRGDDRQIRDGRRRSRSFLIVVMDTARVPFCLLHRTRCSGRAEALKNTNIDGRRRRQTRERQCTRGDKKTREKRTTKETKGAHH